MKVVFSSSPSFQSLGREVSKSLSTFFGLILYLSSLFARTQNDTSARTRVGVRRGVVGVQSGVQLHKNNLTTSLKSTNDD